ncbi:indolepyruvate ferredoxin oxidoreductase family protein [uncultured Roseobacter sp.]|uniref:indolepyruvate ferredoxin oxidoreductase family protein n=1 Tax=uncultured Roseobacter sp. TaxID=114847 RepID=UPI002602DD65|nr:indolepyruvate ferredoxin oxidoreductase family protein [uncultured Roseobacter sp.]
MTDQTTILEHYELEERYTRTNGRVFLTGTQAIIRIALDQARRDRARGLDTRGYISGYRGSPVGGVDLEIARNKDVVADAGITFLPAINEEFGATQMIGTQQVETDPDKDCLGVFGLWYGKGPGVDRASDALKHGNAYGSSPHGGVLVVAGDDHGCVSSSMPHQSDVAFMNFFMPTMNPANVAEFLPFAEWGYALSRYSGMWVGFKAISETVESGMSFEVPADRDFLTPDHAIPDTGLHYRWPDLPGPQIEERMEAKKAATLAFARANPIDRVEWGHAHARFGIVTTGKSHLDVLEALRLLGIDKEMAADLGLDIYKVGMVWPLEPTRALDFAQGKQELLVIEEKRGIIESQLKEHFYDFPGQKPQRMVGKRDEKGERLVPWTHELGAVMLAEIIARRLDQNTPGLKLSQLAAKAVPPPKLIDVPGATRTPYFCSGCPHNTSTKVPEGSEALAGIGCHFMASWMNRETTSLIQMGGEGVNWVARSRFNGNKHIFQNLGEGTYYHSGSLAVRQAIAAGTNITYKILFNDAVAMTGGQGVDGPISVQGIAASLIAEGARKVVVVSDHPENFRRADFPAGVRIEHRREMDRIQRELREISGTTVLIYQQTCATEKRRLRKRGKLVDPKRFAVINPLVCEGCGDCSVESNCLSVEPLETEFGRKRQINLNSCNKDFTCLNGFCPSFVTVEGGTLRKRGRASAGDAFDQLKRDLPPPEMPTLQTPWDILVTGVGGTGVVTVGQVIAMAANLEGKGTTVLDFMGFAQKFGPVLSYIRMSNTPEGVHQAKIEPGSADALIGCDLVVSSSPKASMTYRAGKTRGVVNTALMPTGDLVQNRDADLSAATRLQQIAQVLDADLAALDANALSEALLGDSVFANVMMLGAAWQAGLVPLSEAALMRALDLNGVKPEQNKQAFTWGRIAVHAPDEVEKAADLPLKSAETIEELIALRAAFLTAYQNDNWAAQYLDAIDSIKQAETRVLGAPGALTQAAAKGLFKTMSYKDEYEVARLHSETGFIEGLYQRFEGDFKVYHHLAPPLIPAGKDARGRPRKRSFGPWVRGGFRVLAKMKGLRGTRWDLFGKTSERKMERALIGEYRDLLEQLKSGLTRENHEDAVRIAGLIMDVRGFGPVKEEAVHRMRAALSTALQGYGKTSAGP